MEADVGQALVVVQGVFQRHRGVDAGCHQDVVLAFGILAAVAGQRDEVVWGDLLNGIESIVGEDVDGKVEHQRDDGEAEPYLEQGAHSRP
ncbi:hypothetical protein D9M73_273610 [compost metagenome]